MKNWVQHRGFILNLFFKNLNPHLSSSAVICSKLCGLSDAQDIHPIHLQEIREKPDHWHTSKHREATPAATPAFQCVCAQYHTWASDSCMHAHTCNCQDRLSASSCYSLGPNGQRQCTVIRHTAAAAQDRHIYPPCLTPPCSFNVLVSHSESRYEVPPLVVVGAGCSSLHWCPHAVLVVLADENARQLPQSGHVVRLKELALIRSERSHKVLYRGIKSTQLNHVNKAELQQPLQLTLRQSWV